MAEEINVIWSYAKDFGLPLLGAAIGFAGSAYGQYLSYKNSQKHKKIENIDTLLHKTYELEYYRYLTNMWSYSSAYTARTEEIHHHYYTLASQDYKHSLGLANYIMSQVLINFPELSDYVDELHLKTIAAISSKNKVNATKETSNSKPIITPEMKVLEDVLKNFRKSLKDLRATI